MNTLALSLGREIASDDCLFSRLGFAKKKNAEIDSDVLHPSWYEKIGGISNSNSVGSIASIVVEKPRKLSLDSEDEDDSLLRELNQELETEFDEDFVKPTKEDLGRDNDFLRYLT